jgi:PEGA domain-containing protein
MTRGWSRAVAGVIAAVFFAGCASTTIIKTSPPGAKVYLDGEMVGRTPYTMTDTKIVGSTTHVRLELEGYESYTASVSRNEQFSVGACIGGVLVLVPFLWIMDYKPEHSYELTPLKQPPPAASRASCCATPMLPLAMGTKP